MDKILKFKAVDGFRKNKKIWTIVFDFENYNL